MNKQFIKAFTGVMAFAVILAVVVSVKKADATPRIFQTPTYLTSSATSSIQWVNPGVSTSTLVVDSYSPGSISGITKGTLFIQTVATGTPISTLRITPEYAQDGIGCATTQANCDWFLDGGVDYGAYASTSRPFDLGQPNFYRFSFATTTNEGGVGGAQATTTRAFTVNIPTRYARFVISIDFGGTSQKVWAEFVPAKESR